MHGLHHFVSIGGACVHLNASLRYAFGASLEADTTKVVKANGGTVIGSSKHPINSSDFSSNLLQAQASKARVGANKTMHMVALLMYVSDVHSLGLKSTEGLYLTDAWYWDTSEPPGSGQSGTSKRKGRCPIAATPRIIRQPRPISRQSRRLELTTVKG